MQIINVNEKEYKIKFGYKALSKAKVLNDVIQLETSINNNEDDSIALMLSDILDVLARLVLAGLQKYNEDYKVDYDSPKSVENGLNKVCDLLDDYMDDEDNDVFALFGELTNDLTNSGFLLKVSKRLEETMEEQDATTTPTDHKTKS